MVSPIERFRRWRAKTVVNTATSQPIKAEPSAKSTGQLTRLVTNIRASVIGHPDKVPSTSQTPPLQFLPYLLVDCLLVKSVSKHSLNLDKRSVWTSEIRFWQGRDRASIPHSCRAGPRFKQAGQSCSRSNSSGTFWRDRGSKSGSSGGNGVSTAGGSARQSSWSKRGHSREHCASAASRHVPFSIICTPTGNGILFPRQDLE